MMHHKKNYFKIDRRSKMADGVGNKREGLEPYLEPCIEPHVELGTFDQSSIARDVTSQ
jgi:hypothetical protein